jgi:exodeoxyribonuclease-1
MLYSGFFDDADKKLMAQVRRASPAQLAGRPIDFKDARLGEILFRYRARNFPESLSEPELQQWRAFCRERHTNREAGASLTLPELHSRVADLLQLPTTTEPQKNILKDLVNYADSL